MSRPMVRIHNVETNEVIDREMTDKELFEYQALQKKFDDEAQAQAAAQAQKQAILDRLGLTEDELRIVLG